MSTSLDLLKAEYDAFKGFVAGRLDDLTRRVAQLERCDPETMIQEKLYHRLEALRLSLREFMAPPVIAKPPKITLEDTDGRLKKEVERVVALNPPGVFPPRLTDPCVVVGEPKAAALVPTPVSAAEADLRKMFNMSELPARAAPVMVTEIVVAPTEHGTVFAGKLVPERESAIPERESAIPERESAIPERESASPERESAKQPPVDDFFGTPVTAAPVPPVNPPASAAVVSVAPVAPVAEQPKRLRGRPKKSPAPAVPAAAPLFEPAPAEAPASPPVFASVPARVDEAVEVSSARMPEGTKQVFQEVLENFSDGELAKLWERAYNKPLAAMHRPTVIFDLLVAFADPARNFTLEDPQAIGADPSLRLNPAIEGLDE